MTEESRASTKAPSGSAGRVVILAVTGVCVALLGIWYTVCRPAAKVDERPLPVVANVPDFTLTERSGREVSRGDLLGKVWVADFVFTSCAGPCPELSLRMRSLQKTLEETHRDVTLVTVSVDPKTDTPKVLRRYADKFEADPEKWLFLTGPDDAYIHDLVVKGFLLSFAPATQSSPLMHSTRIVMVDREGRIRGSHDGLDVDERDQLLADLDKLLAEGHDGA